MYSVDFYEIEKCQSKGEWDKSAEILSNAAISLEKAGADFIVICTNTMHKVAHKIKKNITIPILHIAEVTAHEIKGKSIDRIGLLGTKYTMEQEFYKNKLIDNNIDVIIPDEEERRMINDIIYNELCLGIISEESKRKFLSVVESFKKKGAQGVILGCTEIGLLINKDDTDVEVFDTTIIHAEKAALYAIEK